ncbi:MAG: hypothetical protein QXF56_02795 [Candidatus Micrarchaeia archaeon]
MVGRKKSEMEWEKMRFKCLECGRETEPLKITREGIPIRVWKCLHCNFAITHPEDAERLLLKEKGVRATVGKVGSQTIIRVPAVVREYYHLDRIKKILLKPVSDKKLVIEI